MKKVLMLLLGCLWTITTLQAQIGKVGINTPTPAAMLHVKDSSVLFTGIHPPPGTGNPPISGVGTRMMWYPDKAAFRAGNISGTQWNRDSIGLYSIALGQNTKANGFAASAMGTGTTASGHRSTALGTETTASGYGSTALGDGTVASGSRSTALGKETTASFNSSTAMGSQTTASAYASTAMGSQTTANGYSSTAMGDLSTASGSYSTAMGNQTLASGESSTAMGVFTKSKPFASLVLGQFNDTSSISSTNWNLDDPVFIIGNGSSNSARSNAITVLKDAKTGINIENPQAGLHIKGIEATYDAHIRMETAGSGTDYANILYDGNMKFRTFTAGDEYQWRNSANNTRMTLQDDGDLFIDGVLTPNSDLRLKKDLEPIHNGLDKIRLLQGYHYQWIDSGRDPALQTGLIAQDIEQIMPELVKTDNDGMKGVNYIGIIPYLIEGMKEQQEIISAQQMKLDSQQARLESLEKEMHALKALIVNREP